MSIENMFTDLVSKKKVISKEVAPIVEDVTEEVVSGAQEAVVEAVVR